MGTGPGIWMPRWIKANRNLALFVALLLIIVLLPTFEDSSAGEVILAGTSMVIIAASVVGNGRSRGLFWAALLLSVPAVLLRLIAFVDGYGGRWSGRGSSPQRCSG